MCEYLLNQNGCLDLFRSAVMRSQRAQHGLTLPRTKRRAFEAHGRATHSRSCDIAHSDPGVCLEIVDRTGRHLVVRNSTAGFFQYLSDEQIVAERGKSMSQYPRQIIQYALEACAQRRSGTVQEGVRVQWILRPFLDST
jgi:hypothetical protein